MIRIHKPIRRAIVLLMAALVGLAGVGLLGNVTPIGLWQTAPVSAQRVRPDGVWQLIYQQVPSLPREDQYVSKETGKTAADNTLVGRLIRYHLYVKGRSPFLRFDWKLTLADYLGVNEPIEEATYPSQSTLQQPPYEGDMTAVRSLDRAQRAVLVEALVSAFAPQIARPVAPAPSPLPSSQPTAVPTPQPSATPGLRGPGAAQLLQP